MKIIDARKPNIDYSQFKRGDVLEVKDSKDGKTRYELIIYSPYADKDGGQYGLVYLKPNDEFDTRGDIEAFPYTTRAPSATSVATIRKGYACFARSIPELLRNSHFYSVKKSSVKETAKSRQEKNESVYSSLDAGDVIEFKSSKGNPASYARIIYSYREGYALESRTGSISVCEDKFGNEIKHFFGSIPEMFEYFNFYSVKKVHGLMLLTSKDEDVEDIVKKVREAYENN